MRVEHVETFMVIVTLVLTIVVDISASWCLGYNASCFPAAGSTNEVKLDHCGSPKYSCPSSFSVDRVV